MTEPATGGPERGGSLSEYAADLGLRMFFSAARIMPYERRVRSAGAFMEHAIVPLTDIRKRVYGNLKLVFPDMAESECRRIFRGCVYNFTRIFMETYATDQFVWHVSQRIPSGPGLEEIDRAVVDGRPVILVTGHFGNPQAGRVQLIRRGHSVGCVYREMNNQYFNRHYVRTMKRIGEPVFPRGSVGTREFLKFVRDGGITLVLNDQYASEGDQLNFMGLPARTNTAVARIAVRSGALLVPFYAVRRPDGLEFDVEFESPVPHGDHADMTQQLNRSLEARVRAHPEQWYWIHRRWKDTADSAVADGA